MKEKILRENEDIDISSLELTVEPVVREKTDNLLDRVISEEIPKTLGKIPREIERRVNDNKKIHITHDDSDAL